MKNTESINCLLSARRQLETRSQPSISLTIDIDTVFIKSGILITPSCLLGAFRFDDVVDWVRRNAGYVILNVWKYYPKGDYVHNCKKEQFQMRAFDVGNAFVWGLPDVIVNSYTNPYIGDEQAMTEILKGHLTTKTITRCEKN